MRAMRYQAGVNNTDFRGEQRVPLGRPGTLRREGREQSSIRIADLTRDGCRIESDEVLLPDEQVVIGMAGIGSVEARVVWRSASGYGCAFLVSLSPGGVSAAFEDNVVALPGSADSNGASASDDVVTFQPLHPSPPKPSSARATIAVIVAVSAAGWALLMWGLLSL